MREDSSLVIESIPLTDITSVHAHDEEARNIGEDTSCLHSSGVGACTAKK